jgi:hypothetical protein
VCLQFGYSYFRRHDGLGYHALPLWHSAKAHVGMRSLETFARSGTIKRRPNGRPFLIKANSTPVPDARRPWQFQAFPARA